VNIAPVVVEQGGITMMARAFLAAMLAAALFTGCKSASPRWSSTTTTTARDPQRWERAACWRGEYPVELDERALVWARYEDVRASHGGSPTSEAARVERERIAFDARCNGWRMAMLYDAF
jgi:hypothetical protein